jgi:hypothetical protein
MSFVIHSYFTLMTNHNFVFLSLNRPNLLLMVITYSNLNRETQSKLSQQRFFYYIFWFFEKKETA